jgi:hypothetical protein
MTEKWTPGPWVLRADGLPNTDVRWTAHRKRKYVRLLGHRLIDRAAFLERHAMSEEELAGWERAYADKGFVGLTVTKQAQNRDRTR